MPIAFTEYLNAKFTLDDRSLNPIAYDSLLSTLKGKNRLRWLDIGTGTGAMIHRLVEASSITNIDAVGLDHDQDILASAAHTTTRRLQGQGYTIANHGQIIHACSDRRSLNLEFVCQNIGSPSSKLQNTFDLVTAHAFMDVVPLMATATLIADYLVEGGLFYSTLNYDGGTTFFPVYKDSVFERIILSHYDQSMENRRVDGQVTGGAYSGRRLVSTLQDNGFDIIAYGSSDWNITPVRGQYLDQDATCITVLLDMILGEATHLPALNPEKLNAWYQDRMQRVEQQQLGLIIHQLDVLARIHLNKANDCR